MPQKFWNASNRQRRRVPNSWPRKPNSSVVRGLPSSGDMCPRGKELPCNSGDGARRVLCNGVSLPQGSLGKVSREVMWAMPENTQCILSFLGPSQEGNREGEKTSPEGAGRASLDAYGLREASWNRAEATQGMETGGGIAQESASTSWNEALQKRCLNLSNLAKDSSFKVNILRNKKSFLLSHSPVFDLGKGPAGEGKGAGRKRWARRARWAEMEGEQGGAAEKEQRLEDHAWSRSELKEGKQWSAVMFKVLINIFTRTF